MRNAIRYARITLAGHRPFIIRVTNETERVIAGIEVDASGDEVVPPGHHNRLRIIERTAIRKIVAMRMNNHYGTLEAE